MHAIHEAKQMFVERGLNFEQRLCWYLENGLVVVRPDRFLMAKPIRSWVGDDDWNAPDADCWYVDCAVGKGSLEWFLLQAPYRLPKLAWRRTKAKDNVLKYYPTDKFERLSS